MLTLGDKKLNSQPDFILLLSTFTLLAIGLVMISSASMDYASQRYDDPFYHTRRHAIYLIIALIAGFIASKVSVELWQRSDKYLLLLSFIILTLIIIPGVGLTANNATRWLKIGPLTLQGSEVAKLGVIVYLGSYLVRQNDLVRSKWSGFLNPMAIMMAMVVLLIKEPDFGAVVVLISAALGMLFLGGVRLWQFIITLIGVGGLCVLLVMSSQYRMQRLYSYLDPWSDQFGDGYQLTQALIAFGRGEWFGLGLGDSIQKLFYLPEAHTDFIFAIIAEELGFIGCLLVLSIYIVLIGRILFIARKAESMSQSFSAYVAYGVSIVFSAQLFINVGVNIGLLPTKGLTLPFLSYGGSSLLVSCVLIGLVLRIHQELTAEQGSLRVKKYGTKSYRSLVGNNYSEVKGLPRLEPTQRKGVAINV
ncbi:MAG: putative lipid II flippase FtsW [Pseudomonadota bacterium]|nr:putative lipid II flippase FtsW [Pseudomonadota bacterium]